MKALDLFCGAGGMSQGIKSVPNVTLEAGVDYDEDAIMTHKQNHPNAKSIKEDLVEISPEEFSKEYDIDKKQISLITGGPPCQGFSNANYVRDDDDRNNLVFIFTEYCRYFDPEYIMMENVPGIGSLKDGYYVSEIVNDLESYGYNIEYRVINTADYAVPQTRNRFILLGRKSEPVDFPDPAVSKDEYKTVSDAISHLTYVEAGEESSDFPNHRAPNHHNSTIERISKADWGEEVPYDNWSQKTRLHPHEPSPTILAGKRSNYHRAHPEADRGLTVRERASIQSFPDDYEFYGPVTSQRRQTGNAFPPKAAETLINQLINGS